MRKKQDDSVNSSFWEVVQQVPFDSKSVMSIWPSEFQKLNEGKLQ